MIRASGLVSINLPERRERRVVESCTHTKPNHDPGRQIDDEVLSKTDADEAEGQENGAQG